MSNSNTILITSVVSIAALLSLTDLARAACGSSTKIGTLTCLLNSLKPHPHTSGNKHIDHPSITSRSAPDGGDNGTTFPLPSLIKGARHTYENQSKSSDDKHDSGSPIAQNGTLEQLEIRFTPDNPMPAQTRIYSRDQAKELDRLLLFKPEATGNETSPLSPLLGFPPR